MKNLVPSYILHSYKKGDRYGVFNAYSLFLDISGFTAMTEQLSAFGKDGAEELSDILKFLFTTAVDAVYNNGGFIVNYAGDAFTALFQNYNDNPELANSVIAAAEQISDFFLNNSAYTSRYGSFNFGVKIGLAYGDAEWQIVESNGSAEEERAVYYFKGSAVDLCAKAEHQAKIGEIIFDQSFIEQLNSKYSKHSNPVTKTTYKLNNQLIKEISTSVCAKGKPENNQHYSELLEKFTGRNELNFPVGEFREIVSVFISFTATDKPEELLKIIFRNREIYGGCQPKVDFGDKGGTILLFFGAPIAYENDKERALKFSLAILKEVEQSRLKNCFKVRIGLTDGLVYAGFNGSEKRSEFTCLGNAVNQSARFMMNAEWGEILFAQSLTDNPGFSFVLKGEFAYKGRSGLIKTYRLTGTKTVEKKYTDVLVGRDTELSELFNLLKPLENGQSGGFVILEGAAGIGKSRLVHEIKQLAKFDSKWLEMPCDELIQKSFNPFVHYIRDFFGILERNDSETNKNLFKSKFAEFVNSITQVSVELKTELRRLQSFLGALLDLYWSDSLYEQFDAKARYDNTMAVLDIFFRALAEVSPVTISIDDIQWIDANSLDMINRLGISCSELPLIILATSRLEDNGIATAININESISCTRLHLKPLDQLPIKEITITKLQVPAQFQELNGFKTLAEFVYEKSSGNPFYAEQILLYLKNSNLITTEFALVYADFSAAGSLHSVIIARIDRMENELAEMVKTASVFGKEFAVDVLVSMLKELSGVDLAVIQKQLDCGEKDNIWETINQIKYLFKHAMLRDVAYEMQLSKQLKKLHLLAAETTEKLYSANITPYLPDLAYHFDKAESFTKAMDYLDKAGVVEKDNYRNVKALEYFNRWIEIADLVLEIKDGDYNSVQVDEFNRELVIKYIDINVLRRCMIYSSFMAKHDVAQEILDNSMILAEKTEDKNMLGLVYFEMGNLFMKTNKMDLALECTEKSLKLYKETNNLKKNVLCYYLLGMLAYRRGNIDDAIIFLEQSATIAKKINEKKMEAKALSSLGTMYDFKGNLDKAVELYEERLKISKEIGNDKLGMQFTIGNLAVIYSLQKEYDKAINLFEEKLNLCKEFGDKRGMVIALNNIGKNYSDLHDPQKALDFFNQAKYTANSMNFYKELTDVVLNIANCFSALLNYTEAEIAFSETEILIQKFNLINVKASFLIDEANYLLSLGNKIEAANLCKQGLAIAEQQKQASLIKDGKKILKKIKNS